MTGQLEQVSRELLDDLNWTIAFLFNYGHIGKAEQVRKAIAILEAAPAVDPVAMFDGYIDGTAVIQWRGQGLPAGTLLYAAPVAPADTRAAFEAHFALSTRQAWRTTDGAGYQNTDVQKWWEGWQAARSAPSPTATF